MTTTHVFIVDTNTFKYHLEYLFAGTGAKDNFIDFNNNPNTSLNHTTENNLVDEPITERRGNKAEREHLKRCIEISNKNNFMDE